MSFCHPEVNDVIKNGLADRIYKEMKFQSANYPQINFSRHLSRFDWSVLSASMHQEIMNWYAALICSYMYLAGDMSKYPPFLQWNGTTMSTHGDSPGLF